MSVPPTPSTNRANRRVISSMVALMGVVFAFGGWFFAIALTQRLEKARVAMTAHAPGHVVAFEAVPGTEATTWRPEIAFTPPNLALVQFSTEFSSTTAKDKWPVGTTVDVVFDPRSPSSAEAPAIEAQGRSMLRNFGYGFLIGGIFLSVGGLSVLLRS